MSSNPFPFNQCLAAATISSGPFQGSVLIVAVYHNGISVAQNVPVFSSSPTTTSSGGTTATSSSSGPVTYTPTILPNLYCGGSVNTALEFLINPSNMATPPYYFLCGAQSNSVYLYSFAPVAGNEQLSASNIVQISEVFSCANPVASIIYDPTPGASPNLLVTDSTGIVTAYNVSFPSSGQPSFQPYAAGAYVLSNVVPGGVSAGGAVQLGVPVTNSSIACPPGAYPMTAYMTGGLPLGIYNIQGNGPTGATGQAFPTPTVAIACAPTCMYVATATAIYQCSYPLGLWNSMDHISMTPISGWSASQTITSLVWCPMSNSTTYPNGILLIGSYATSCNGAPNGIGSIYQYVPGAGTPPAPGEAPGLKNGGTSGPVYGMVADQNAHVFFAFGSTGLGYQDLSGDNLGVQSAVLVQNTAMSSSGESFLQKLEADTETIYNIAKNIAGAYNALKDVSDGVQKVVGYFGSSSETASAVAEAVEDAGELAELA